MHGAYAQRDRTLAPDLGRYMADRIGAHTEQVDASHTEQVDASHAVMVSRPGTVTRLVEEADRSTR
ncbi:hypothetical protein JBE04_22255 [Streptomyces sp. PRKS01-29]|nr:hypothetical protein [Streptomyces sabulosicollis]MBI0297114.1 hypothetical protein [Streptomyces sabulosicollis]